MINKLLTVLKHSKTIDIPGVSKDEINSMMDQLQPVDQVNDYKNLLTHTVTMMDVNVDLLRDALDRDEPLDDYDMVVMFGNTISRLPINADLYSDFCRMIDNQFEGWEEVTD